MKIAILYGSSHGKTSKVVAETVQHLNMPVDVFDVRLIGSSSELVDYDLFIFFSPTYGDEELQSDMEEFLLRCELSLAGKHFAICELGSYYGYEDFSFGAMRILRKHLLQWNGCELCEPLSLDSFPRTNREHLLNWVDYLKGQINEHFRFCNA
ncbi:MAG: flavodoxin domain-containing protein [Verrucomicrobia bacterium]|nr:flavodoxin domain-containing protein [Verrucomicrobiota bacterium]